MGRMWQSIILSNWNLVFAWLPIETLIEKKQNEYYRVLGECDSRADSEIFIEFILQNIYDSLVELKLSEEITIQIPNQVKKLLSVMEAREYSSKELMETLGLKHRPTFRDNYLLPALVLELVEMTIPDKPNSSKQKYRKL